jgi:ferric-dicitrate binding protein FerR (iron transport regulator)
MPSGTQTTPTLSQAARWFAASHRRVTTLEQSEDFRRWARDADNRNAFAEMQRIWADIERVQSRIETAPGLIIFATHVAK